ncbi:hypothetical protein D0860_02917 [Hortaea werneckii]|uniref:Cytochrome P450 n=1 Tax=Hortaea werneckii TaxID=91943 RepID=A0A3M7HH28_HORWE|nr:hypothetical protein D0860_02917 [Hortaea werneckii]
MAGQTTLLVSISLLALTTIAYIYNRTNFHKRGKQLPPGPLGLPIIGSALQMPKRLPWLEFHRMSRQYGPIMYMNLAGRSAIILSTYQAAHDLLSVRSALYSDRPRVVMAGELACKGMHTLLRPYDARYKLHQRMATPFLNPSAANRYRPLQELESRQLLSDLLNGSEKEGEYGIDPHHVLERAMASFIYSLLYGYRLRTGNERELREAKRVLAEYEQTAKPGAYLVDAFPALNCLPRPFAPWKDKADQLYEQQANLHLGNLAKALQQEGPNVAKLMHLSQEAKNMTEVEVAFSVGVVSGSMLSRDLSADVLGKLADAAIDTSAMTLNWLIVAALTTGAEWVQKAQSIIDKVVGRDRLPQWEDRPGLTYIDAIINEGLRWRPIIAGGVPHFTKKPDVYGDYYIPANTIVLPNLYAIARDETTFGSEVGTFIPERWIDANDKLKDLPDVGFGFGRRICAGRYIARNGLFIKVARLLWAFNIEPGVDRTTGEAIEVSDTDCVDGLVVLPKPFKAVFRPRCDSIKDVIDSYGNVGIDDHLQTLNNIF